MSLKLYNTLSRKKEEFKPRIAGSVNMYVCGPTVYNFISIGNSRPIIVFNMVRNYFKYLGYKVNLVQNITDIEDKIINKANEEKVDYEVITKRYIKAFMEDLKSLDIDGFDSMPLATEMIDEIIDVISRILENGYGYEIDGNVYFDVVKFKDYGKLSGQKIEEMQESECSVFEKKNRIDFALWKKAKEGEPSWDSPWGKGRPGWHIECSAMSINILGHNIDIHGGGIDLVFPHHENEIAQSEAAFPGKGNFSNYWMHNGMIEVKAEKMSKSSGLKEDWILKNLLKKYSPDVIKMYTLSTHYRSPLEFSSGKLEEAKKALERIINTLKNMDFLINSNAEDDNDEAELSQKIEAITDKLESDFKVSMDDDFNSARGIGVIFDCVKNINSVIQDPDFRTGTLLVDALRKAYEKMIQLGGVIGLNLSRELKRMGESSREDPEIAKIEEFIKQRDAARENRDFKEADRIRDMLLSMNIILEDRKEGTIWKRRDRLVSDPTGTPGNDHGN